MEGNTIIPIADGVSMMRFEYRYEMEKALELWEEHKKEMAKLCGEYKETVYGFAYWLYRYSGLIQPVEQPGK